MASDFIPKWTAVAKRLFVYLVIMLSSGSHLVQAQSLPADRPLKVLALGDSYTIGESVAEDQRWPLQLMHALKKRQYISESPLIIATTGWRTDELKRAVETRNLPKDYDLVSLLIGVNNQYQGRSIEEYEREFSQLLTIAIEHARGDKSRVFVLSIPDYGFTPFGIQKQKTISKEIDAFNAVNKNITEKSGVTYIDITDLTRRGLEDPELVAHDGLHPSGKMYTLWVSRILNHLNL